MTKEELEKLAREFAEHTSNGDALDPYIDYATKLAKDVLQWLCKTHCIVERQAVIDLENEIFANVMDCHKEDDWQSAADYVLYVMPRSFNTVFGEELFNDTET